MPESAEMRSAAGVKKWRYGSLMFGDGVREVEKVEEVEEVESRRYREP
jgi:hypothetical protein